MPVIHEMISMHAQEVAFLWTQRGNLLTRANTYLDDIISYDERIDAHLDGLRIAGAKAWRICETQLIESLPGEMFAAMTLALEAKDIVKIKKLSALASAVPTMQPGFTSAFGWTTPRVLSGMVVQWLGSPVTLHRRTAIACCALHRVDAGPLLEAASNDVDTSLRARALRAAGELGRLDLLPICRQHLEDQDPDCAFWASWSSVLLGDRDLALTCLARHCRSPDLSSSRASQLVLKVLTSASAHQLLRTYAGEEKMRRPLLRGVGIVGDPFYVPWLINQMDELHSARLAGESFSQITGADLVHLGLNRQGRVHPTASPNDDPDDDRVDMDPDEYLPWPDKAKVQSWWRSNKERFFEGMRYFVGYPVSEQHCMKVLGRGCQRQRVAAALYLSLLHPGKPLYRVSAPGWRQKRLLDGMNSGVT